MTTASAHMKNVTTKVTTPTGSRASA